MDQLATVNDRALGTIEETRNRVWPWMISANQLTWRISSLIDSGHVTVTSLAD